MSITLLGLNNAPDAVDDYRDDIAEDSAGQAITVLANDSDPDSDSLTIIAVIQPSYGEVTFTSSQVTYIPAEGYFGADEFTYTISDPDGLTDTASVFVTVDNIDDSVVAYDDWAYAPMNGTGHLIDVLANDEDPDGDTLSITLPGQGQGGYPAHGAITVVAGSPEQVRYTPAAEYFGYDEFVYTVDDGHGNNDTATVSVIVYKLTVNVSPGYCVPGVSPARWAVPVGDEYYGTVVTLVVDTLPESIPLDEMSIAWTGADVDLDYSVYAYHDRTLTGAYNVGVQVTDEDDESIDADVELVAVGIDRIVSDDANLLEAETGNSDNAVTGVSSDPASVTVKALVTPSTPDVSAVYNKLIVWGGSRGSVGITPDRYGLPRDYPARLPVSARIGASSDALDVWAVRVNVRVGGLSEEQEELDANAVSVYVNSDDNNASGTPDMYESNNVLGLGVAGEDDLIPVSIGLEPRGVPVGELALVLPAGDHFAACANDDKSGGRLNPASWSLDAGRPPYGIALEGVSLTEPQSLLLQYSLDSTLLSQDSAKIKCVTHPSTVGGTGGAFFKMYSARPIGGSGGGVSSQSVGAQSVGGGISAQSAGAPLSRFEQVTVGDAVGGDVTVAFVVSLKPNSYVMADAASLLYTDDAYPDEVSSINLGVYFTQGGWLVYDESGNSPPDEWEPFIDGNGKTSIGSPIHEPTYTLRDDRIVVATTQTINTRVFPWSLVQGTNGPHSVRLHKLWFDADPENEFDADPFPINENGYLTEYDVKPLPYNVSNLTIKDVRAEKSAKPEDYFKYDPDPESQYHRPVIHCTVDDEGDPHEYRVFMIVRPTGATGWLKPDKTYPASYGWDVKTIGSPGDVTFTWDGSTWPRGVPDQADWGTYTYEVFAYEYKTGEKYFQNWDDWFYYKYPYCMSLPADYTSILFDYDHLFMYFSYILGDYAYDQSFNNYESTSDIVLIPIDGDLNELSKGINSSSEINIPHENILVYNTEVVLPGTIRTVAVGKDNCWYKYRRDHINSSMLAENSFFTIAKNSWNFSRGFYYEMWLYVRSILPGEYKYSSTEYAAIERSQACLEDKFFRVLYITASIRLALKQHTIYIWSTDFEASMYREIIMLLGELMESGTALYEMIPMEWLSPSVVNSINKYWDIIRRGLIIRIGLYKAILELKLITDELEGARGYYQLTFLDMLKGYASERTYYGVYILLKQKEYFEAGRVCFRQISDIFTVALLIETFGIAELGLTKAIATALNTTAMSAQKLIKAATVLTSRSKYFKAIVQLVMKNNYARGVVYTYVLKTKNYSEIFVDKEINQIFKDGAVHTHLGLVDHNNYAVGFHNNNIPYGPGRIIPGTKTPPDANGVYMARVEILNYETGQYITKGPRSSFWPEDLSIEEINEQIYYVYSANKSRIPSVAPNNLAFTGRSTIPGRPFEIKVIICKGSDNVLDGYPIYDP